jgi:hypothetical protein
MMLNIILSRVGVTKDGHRIGNWIFINHLQVVTTINYYTIAALHNITSHHTNLFSLFAVVFVGL